jgi:hypothetical protein
VLQLQQEFQRPVEDALFMRQRHRGVPFVKVHADVEIHRPVRLAGGDARIHPQRAVAFVLQRPVALGLAHDVFERAVGQRLSSRKVNVWSMPSGRLIQCQRLPFLVKAEPLRIVPRLGLHDQFQRVPARQRHVRQDWQRSGSSASTLARSIISAT